jgi:glycosyltransferase involved in cell wall biosynthesis
MNSPPTVSVIIPFYSGEKYIEAALGSVFGQNYDNLQVIVVDDGSPEPLTKKALGRFSGVEVIRSDNQGAAGARNIGLNACSGDFVKFLDADDLLFPDSLIHEVNFSLGLEQDEFSVGRSLRMSECLGSIEPHASRDGRPVHNAPTVDLLLDCPLVTAPLYPRSILFKIGGFSEGRRYREDYELFARLLVLGYRPRLFDRTVFIYRDHSYVGRVSKQQLLSVAENQLEMFEELVEMYRQRGSDNDVAKGLAQAIWQSGRSLLRAGAEDLALRYFALAASGLSSEYVLGRPLYRYLVQFFGPQAAELALSSIKAWTK